MSITSRFWKAIGCVLIVALMVCAGQLQAAVISSVVETGGDNEATDTIVAQWTGQTFTVSVANEPVPGAVVGNPFTVGTFGDLAPTFVDRNHRYTNTNTGTLVFPIPSYLVGAEYIMSGNDNRDNAQYRLDVTVSTPARALMLIDNRLGKTVEPIDNTTPPVFDATHMQWILDQGWTAVTTGANRTGNLLTPDEVGLDEGADGGINQWYSIFAKDMPAGTFSLFQADNAGRNMYGVVVIPEPSTVTLLATAALALVGFCRRRGS